MISIYNEHYLNNLSPTCIVQSLEIKTYLGKVEVNSILIQHSYVITLGVALPSKFSLRRSLNKIFIKHSGVSTTTTHALFPNHLLRRKKFTRTIFSSYKNVTFNLSIIYP